jgi:RimJ/RimL family protein N-acetyltransferase
VSHPFLTGSPERLTTERLLLEPLRPAHPTEMVVVLDDPELHRHVGGQPLLLEELRKRYEHRARGRSDDGSERWFNWIIRDRTSGDALGYVQATVEAASGIADVAWVVGSRFQGRGYAREAASAMVSWLCGNGVTAVSAHLHPGTRASEKVARAIGLGPTPTIAAGEVIWKSEGRLTR